MAQKSKTSVSFALPMFNEQDNIIQTIEKIKLIARELTDNFEIVIADDASTDNSWKILQELASKDKSIRPFKLDKNTKFGGAFSTAITQAKKEIIIYTDSDMPVTLSDIKKSYSFINEYDVINGCSTIKKGDTLKRKIMSFIYNKMVQIFFRLNIKDINSGYKIIKRSVIEGVTFISKSPFVDVELFIHAKKKNAKIYQYPLIFNQRVAGASYIARFPVILATLRDLFKVLITMR
ncbi:Glycosyl transferase, family 2 [Candidatus Omnitrophus magneticus]|uniref:Glycosyl transferase, family 2 n=1 Tax=Candidatus Omnitrophus magneticus TaxID=1609969 RepID=A0A0F0CWD1_9BACT|nr:Glycosyl transferase, family 2 [Candidatus Omnitrophus magneticus]